MALALASESAYLFRSHAFDRPAAAAVVATEGSSEPAAGQEGYVEPGAQEPEYAGPVALAF